MLAFLLSGAGHAQAPGIDTQLLTAAGKGDIAAVAALLEQGADINTHNGFGVTALYYAADRGNVQLVKLLLDRGADPNLQDFQWGRTPLRVAAAPWNNAAPREARAEIVRLLLEKRAGGDGDALPDLIRNGYVGAARTILERGTVVTPSYLNAALAAATSAGQRELVDLLTRLGAREPGPLDMPRSPERLKLMTGRYRSASGEELRIVPAIHDDELWLERSGRDRVALLPASLMLLRSQDLKIAVTLRPGTLPPAAVIVRDGGRPDVFERIGDVAPSARQPAAESSRTPRTAPARPAAGRPAASVSPVPSIAPTRHWPSFRGPQSSGVAHDAHPPIQWDLTKGTNIAWKTAIPGFAHSSPIVWGDRIFVTTAVRPSEAELTFRHGTQAGVASIRDAGSHSWQVYAVDRHTGKILWNRVAHEGVPRSARHVMASQANSTPATDGTHLVVFFGSEGLYCYDLTGKLLWKRDLGPLVSGRYMDPGYEWNTASSPIIYRNLVILQLDLVENSYIAAFDIASGRDVWQTARDEIPSWPTPMLYEGPMRPQLVTAGGKFARAYDPETGKEIWRLGRHSDLPVPTPVAGHGLIFISSGGGSTVQPIYAVRPDATGDISLADDHDSNDYVVWSRRRGGPHLATPLVYEGLLYISSANGILAAYKADTGEQVYQDRLTRGGSYSASGVAADGKLYYASEDGDVVVVKAGPEFAKLSTNPMGELIMATPAIAGNMIVFRTQHHLVAVAERQSK